MVVLAGRELADGAAGERTGDGTAEREERGISHDPQAVRILDARHSIGASLHGAWNGFMFSRYGSMPGAPYKVMHSRQTIQPMRRTQRSLENAVVKSSKLTSQTFATGSPDMMHSLPATDRSRKVASRRMTKQEAHTLAIVRSAAGLGQGRTDIDGLDLGALGLLLGVGHGVGDHDAA